MGGEGVDPSDFPSDFPGVGFTRHLREAHVPTIPTSYPLEVLHKEVGASDLHGDRGSLIWGDDGAASPRFVGVPGRDRVRHRSTEEAGCGGGGRA